MFSEHSFRALWAFVWCAVSFPLIEVALREQESWEAGSAVTVYFTYAGGGGTLGFHGFEQGVGGALAPVLDLEVAESARAHSYSSSSQVQKLC